MSNNQNDQYIGCKCFQRTRLSYLSKHIYLSTNISLLSSHSDPELEMKSFSVPVLAWWPSSERICTSLSCVDRISLLYLCIASSARQSPLGCAVFKEEYQGVLSSHSYNIAFEEELEPCPNFLKDKNLQMTIFTPPI